MFRRNNPHAQKTTTNLTTIKSAGISTVGIQTKINKTLVSSLQNPPLFKSLLMHLVKRTFLHIVQLYEYRFLPPLPRILENHSIFFSFFFFFPSSSFACGRQNSSHKYLIPGGKAENQIYEYVHPKGSLVLPGALEGKDN